MIRVIPTTETMRAAILSSPRRMNIYMHIGGEVDNTAADDISSTESDSLPMSSPLQIVDAKYALTPNLATYEGDGIPTATEERVRVPPLEPTEGALEVGIWSSGISDAQGAVDWTLDLGFGSPHTSAITVYTSEVNILEAEVTFRLQGEVTLSGTYVPVNDRLQVPEKATYDSISIRVLRLDQPFRHVRITEIEFGMSLTLSRSSVTGTVEYVSEIDPMGISVPLRELTFSVVNRDHLYDFDAPGRDRELVRIGNPVMLSFQASTSKGLETVPCGRFYIRTIDTSNGEAVVTANDPRVLFTDVSTAWTVPTTQSIGSALDDVCGGMFIPHTCDEALYSMYPPRDLEFTSATDYLEDITDMLQLMDVDMVPGYDGVLAFRPHADPEDYGAVDRSLMYSYPLQQSVLRRYNMVVVRYGDHAYELDLRTDPSVQAASQIIVDNPLLGTQEEAVRVAERVREGIHAEELETEWRGDPTLEVGDLAGFPGRWSDAAPRRVVKQSLRFDGGMSVRTTTVL